MNRIKNFLLENETYEDGLKRALRCWAAQEEKLQAENAKLRELLIERDGGSHDNDCKINNPGIKRCNCGHDDVKALLEVSDVMP